MSGSNQKITLQISSAVIHKINNIIANELPQLCPYINFSCSFINLTDQYYIITFSGILITYIITHVTKNLRKKN